MSVEYPLKPLAEVAELIDSLHKTPKYCDFDFPMVRVTDIRRGYLDLSSTLHVDGPTYAEFAKKYKPQEGDTLFTRVGSYGNSCYVRRAVQFCLGQNTVCIAPKRTRIVPYYLYCCLNSDFVKGQIQGFVGGASQPTISLANINKLCIPCPHLPAQARIASILMAYDDLIENNTRRIKILEEMAQMLYREWFVNFRFPGHEKVRMVDSEVGPIPEGWRTGILRDVCESMEYGYTASANANPIGPKFLRITDIVPSSIDWLSVPHCAPPEKNAERYALREGDIVVARTGATTGFAKRLNKKHPACIFASYLVRLRIKPPFSNHLFGALVESGDYKKFVQSNWSGAAQPQANAQILTSVPIVIAPERLHARFTEVATPLFDLKETLQLKNLNLRTTRDLLLPKLISGEIPVEAADEAAAELMEEIAQPA